MIKRLSYILYTLLPLLMLVSCADEPDVQSDDDVDFCVRAVWHNGLADGSTTRAFTATDILAEGTGDIAINYADYPSLIEVTCSDGNYFTLSKGASVCSSHLGYWSYTPSYLYKQKYVIRHKLSFHATAQIDAPTYSPLTDELYGEFSYENLSDTHMLFTLHHTRALLRFTFQVDSRYDKVRYILITGIKFNGIDCPVAAKVLKVSSLSPVAYCYLDPDQADLTEKTNTIECTYSIYDKDANFVTEGNVVTEASIDANAPHLTRQDVKARNTFKLAMVFSGSPAAITAGYYYDLKVTLNPDYLYVLSDHDNNHMTIQ
ncbi:MAG: hypothetical protein KBT39_02780 [Bacteroidales bacterium]|nr:hypothetical protein [Bacteroidales bacterium]